MAKLGQQVDVYCGRCKVERYHTVAALGEGGRIERVVCGYCQSSRKYRDPAFSTPRRASSGGAPRRSREVDERPDPNAAARPYTPEASYEKGEVVLHARYGRGKVTDVRGDRIDVKFVDGEARTFLHSPGGS
jgi:hypothetical protein